MLGHSVICTQVPGVWPGAEQEVELVPGRWKPRTPGLATRSRRLARRRLWGGIVLISDVLSKRPSFNYLMLFVSDMLLCSSPCHWAPAPATSWPQLTHATADISVSLGFSAFSHVVVTRHNCLVQWPGRRFYARGNFVRGGKLVFLDEGNYSLRAGPNWSAEEEVLCNRFPAPVNHHRQSIALLYNESQKIWSIMGATNTISHWEELVSQLMTIIGFPNDFPNVVETIIFP